MTQLGLLRTIAGVALIFAFAPGLAHAKDRKTYVKNCTGEKIIADAFNGSDVYFVSPASTKTISATDEDAHKLKCKGWSTGKCIYGLRISGWDSDRRRGPVSVKNKKYLRVFEFYNSGARVRYKVDDKEYSCDENTDDQSSAGTLS